MPRRTISWSSTIMTRTCSVEEVVGIRERVPALGTNVTKAAPLPFSIPAQQQRNQLLVPRLRWHRGQKVWLLAPHDGTAAAALLTGAPVGLKLAGEESGGALGVNVEGVKAGAAHLQRPAHHLSGGRKEPAPDPWTQAASGRGRVNPSCPQALIGVDIADPGHQLLIHEQRLDTSP